MHEQVEPLTQLLEAVGAGEELAAEKLLPLVYDELRRLAATRMAREAPGRTLQATALVHEAWLRLAGTGRNWNSREHFFQAAAEAMRRNLVENAHRQPCVMNGGGHPQHDRLNLIPDAHERFRWFW